MTDCPQLVYTSAGRTLEGPGFGVLLMSADWPASLGTSRSTLGPLIGQPADGAAHGLLTCGGGRLAYAKVALAADDFGRSGNYVVHLLWDATCVLTPRDVLALSRSGGFPARPTPGTEPSRDAPPVRVPRARRQPPAPSADEIDALVPPLAAVLAALEAGAGVVRMPDVSVLFDVLPLGLAGGISVHVGSADPMGDAAAVQVLAGASGQPPADPANATRARALLEAAAKGDPCPDGVTRFDELDAWLFAEAWMQQDPATLTDAQLVAVLTSPGAGRWLASPRAAGVAAAAATEDRAVEAALRTVIQRDGAARAGVRTAELTQVLTGVFQGTRARTADFSGLTQGDLAEAFLRELSRGRRLPRITAEAELLVEQTLGLGHDVPLLSLTEDVEGLAGLAGRRPVVREALLREWTATPWSGTHEALLGQLLLHDPEWLGTLAPRSPEDAVQLALTWAARQMSVRQVERLAVTVASSEVAGRGWALRCVLFGCGLPAEEVADLVARHFEVLARDDAWPRALAREAGARLAGRDGEPPPKRRRR